MPRGTSVIPFDRVEKLIYLIRGQKVMLDSDLAELYGIATKVLKQAVRRNARRFPSDFMFLLTAQEVAFLRSQFVTSSSGWGGHRYRTMAFTEQGVAMLSSVLNSSRAIEVNIAIMRVFVRYRQLIASHSELAAALKELERQVKEHGEKIETVFEVLRRLMQTPEPPRKQIGFGIRERRVVYQAI
jgi:hypothetical protein